MVRFNANGTLDGSYAGDGVARVGAGTFGGAGVEFRALALQPGDKAVVTGEGSVGSNPSGIPLVTPFVRFTSSGAPDGSFSGDASPHYPPRGPTR